MSGRIEYADSAEFLKTMADASIDAVVTDPPAGIAFMGKEWDHHKGGRDAWVAWLAGIMRECLRVLKPGAHALVWAIPRTAHWTMTAIEDAGFEIRDVISHLFGSGFPKSLNIGDGRGTALKPAAEFWILARKPLGSTVAECVLKHGTGAINVDACRTKTVEDITTHGASPEASATSFGGFAGMADRKSDGQKIGRWPSNLLLSHSPGCTKVGRKRVATGIAVQRNGGGQKIGELVYSGTDKDLVRPDATYGDESGTEEVDDWRCVDGCPVAELDRQSGNCSEHPFGVFATGQPAGWSGGTNNIGRRGDATREVFGYGDSGGASRFFPTFAPDPLDDVTPFLYQAKASRSEREEGCEALPARTAAEAVGRDPDSPGAHNPRAGAGRGAGATRFRCGACGKGLSGGGDDHGETSACDATSDGIHMMIASGVGKAIRNLHPTVKPVALMRWLVRLVTPPGGLVLDPFAGSGSTGVACVLEGFDFIGIEMSEEYVAIARARCERAVDVKTDAAVIVVENSDGERIEVKARQAELFA